MGIWQLFIRHAHRDTEDRALDNGLSDKGRKQCEELVAYLEKLRPLRKPKRVFSSPMRRCFETAEYIATWCGVEVEIDLELNEQSSKESDKDFLFRVRNWVEKNKAKSECCYVSHGDLLPIICRLKGSLVADIKKGDLFFLEDDSVKKINDVRQGH